MQLDLNIIFYYTIRILYYKNKYFSTRKNLLNKKLSRLLGNKFGCYKGIIFNNSILLCNNYKHYRKGLHNKYYGTKIKLQFNFLIMDFEHTPRFGHSLGYYLHHKFE